MYTILLSPDGISEVAEQEVGEPLFNGLGQAVFSPDGTIYANISLSLDGDAVYIYRFDRCTGRFSDQQIIPLEGPMAAAGVAISANSRYCYLSAYLNILQIDLWAEDWAASLDTVATYDGYQEPIPGFDSLALPTRFFMAQLSPNGKIYINTTNSVRSLHVINQPNLPGDSCDVQQHSLKLPTLNAFSLPNFPNYELRNLKGSPCDTLGPLAGFSAAPEGLSVAFEDESAKSPASWHWDFGDGSTSTEQHPLHEYAQEGAYEVCLAVSNLYGADTLCQQVEVQLTSTGEPGSAAVAELFPNPTQGELWLRTAGLETEQTVFLEMYAPSGQLLQRQKFLPNETQAVPFEGRPQAVYFYRVVQNGRVLNSGKLIQQ
jgi:hypothetical protein